MPNQTETFSDDELEKFVDTIDEMLNADTVRTINMLATMIITCLEIIQANHSDTPEEKVQKSILNLDRHTITIEEKVLH